MALKVVDKVILRHSLKAIPNVQWFTTEPTSFPQKR